MASGRIRIGFGSPTNYSLVAAPGAYSLSGQTASFNSGAFNFYIGPSGSNSNDGLTTGTPWALDALASAAKRLLYFSKTVGLLTGTYDVSAANTPARSFAIPLYNVTGGSTGVPTIIKSVTPRGAWINAKTAGGVYTGDNSSGDLPNEGGLLGNCAGVTQGYITFDGLKMSGDRATLLRLGQGPNNVSYTGPAETAVKNCELFDCSDSLLGHTGANYATVQSFNTTSQTFFNNYIHDTFSWSPTTADHLSAALWWQCLGTQVLNNTCYKASNLYGKEFGSSGTTSAYNYIEDARSSGINDWVGPPLSGTAKSFFHHNISVVNANGMVFIGTNNTGWNLQTDLDCYNNTVVSESAMVQQHYAFYTTDAGGHNRVNFWNNTFLGSYSADRKPVCASAKTWATAGRNVFQAGTNRFRILLNATYTGTLNPADNQVSAGASTLAQYRTAVAADGGIGVGVMELGSVDTSQTSAQLFTLVGTFGQKYTPKTGSDLIGVGRVEGASGSTVCAAGAIDGVVTGPGLIQIGCDFA